MTRGSGAIARCVGRLRGLGRDTSALAYVEFAYMLPILMVLGLGGIELGNLAITHMRISQVALSLADNASRAKQKVATGLPRLRETDINQALTAAQLQAGGLNLIKNGRIILSSLEKNADGGQWIHWQRCSGSKVYVSSFGLQGDGASGTAMKGMGPAGKQVAADTGFAIMFVEVAYDYQPIIFGSMFGPQVIKKTAAMYVRDDRDLTGDTTKAAKYGNVYNPSPAVPDSKIGFC
ncbi:TadE/TadG family type IV pilus assembly protein [Flavisphingopyxis soli]|uniref:TadE/TadG family type IV pilus assembly protein n=1 Tax=Flavisphingopyxis soli TaxID=2601267 RepID=UPI00191C46A7|nr:TadE/TadG family type IV pilus assembly protein [Sphingorhabdus soli]